MKRILSLFYKSKKTDNKKVWYILRIPVFKIKIKANKKRTYLFGIRVHSKKITPDMSAQINIDVDFWQRHFCSKNSFSALDKTAIFVAGSGAIAEYTVKIHSEMPKIFDIFTDIENYDQWSVFWSKHKNAKHIVFPLESYNKAKTMIDYPNRVFVLGNSLHHKKIFDLACKTKGEKNRWLILHESFVFCCMLDKFDYDFEKIKEFFILWYPKLEKELRKSPANLEALENVLLKHKCCFIRPIIHMTGIKNIIVYSERAKDLIQQELTKQELKDIKLYSLPLPFEPSKEKPEKSTVITKKPKYLIGTFGFPHDIVKRTSDIIKAVELLNKTMDVKLVIAGSGVNNYQNKIKRKKAVVLVEKPSPKEWFALMNTIDLGIQLREHGHGFSSACVTELLGIGKPCLLTEGMVDKKWTCLCDFIPEDLSVEEMAKAIKRILTSKKKADKRLYSDYSFYHNADMIKQFISGK